jgi:predicted ATPase
MTKVVLTGAPGSGKTVLTALLAAERPDRFAPVPEAATQVYARLRTRWDRLDRAGRYDAQRRMYHLQLEQEARLAADTPGKVLLLDRGTVDGAAYWPDGPEPFWRDVGTTHARELARYDAVILLETAAALGLYDGDASNAVRFEDASAALAAGETLKR